MGEKYTIYQDRQGGKFVWWTYAGDRTIYLTWRFVSRELMSKKAKLIKTAECG